MKPGKLARLGGVMPYAEIPLSKQDQANIAEMFEILSTNGAAGLLWNAPHLSNTLGPKVGVIHPVKMMEHVITTVVLKEQLRVIRTKDISVMGFGQLWTTYIEKTGKHLNKVHARGELLFYAEDFAKAVNKDAAQLKELFNSTHKDKWTHLFDYLLK